MILTIAIMVSLTVGVMAYVLAPRMGEGALVFRDTPDPPAAFGCRMAWLAIRTRDTEAVVDALGLAAPEPCNWSAGIGTVYDDTFGTSRVYVTPSVNGWTFAVGLALPHPVGRMFVDKCTPLLLDLGRRFAEVQYFFTYPPIDLYAWARIIDGRLVRACAIGDEGILWRKGHPTREERALGLRLFEFRGLKGRHGDAGGEMILYPTEDHVLRIAGRWSLDPTRLDEAGFPPGLGYIASAPAAWRPERLRRTA